MTDIERIKAWMDAHGWDSASLSQHLGYKHDWLATILTGKRSIREGFMIRFWWRFDTPAFMEAFGFDPRGYRLHASDNPAQSVAQYVVGNAIRDGELPHISTQRCCVCNCQAREYHHASYAEADLLNVIPLCATCHRRHHKAGASFPPLGVVPMRCGLVRIAIAKLDRVVAG